ncbi:glycosyltransferase family protein [Clostridium sp. 'White wine YQ']|uniref:glycosyltransferase family protein n=1 Tax=Clostridium sp. 'White wine YQ' TaxID=3027474 RepID=UPI002366BEBC|nr:glycosyltransferase [Clostridium sp. 'White wine YQ']MDD7794621.1 glycosyltransferase [Clostridium sp. 'White wine YQ']
MADNIIIEKAKDGNWTCKVKIDDKWKYIYSKYNPIKKIENIASDENYIVLGIGLGYELKQIIQNTKGNIYVIDKNENFYNIIQEHNDLNIEYEDRVVFLFGEAYKDIYFKMDDKNLIYDNKNITEVDSKFYYDVLKYLSTREKKKSKLKVAFYEATTVADDCMDALRNIGYDVVKMYFSTKHKMLQDIMDEMPDFIFTINPSDKVSEISRILSIPYISWVVDSPAYSLYSDFLKNKSIFAFVYDCDMALELNSMGLRNIAYMPVAANVSRLDNVHLSSQDVDKYNCDISFLGTVGMDNEFNKFLYEFLSKETISEINEIFNKQHLNLNKYLIKDIVTDKLVTKILEETGYKTSDETFLDSKTKIAYFLAKKYNEIQRIDMVHKLSNEFNMHVYGDENWGKLNLSNVKYKGYAEHFNEMPKVFKCSKININFTRIYVDSGLPMRVFDILGSKGFLVTNHKADIDKYFKDGEDLVKYRDTKDLIEISQYYLNNEQERQKIMISGYEKVKEYHTYEVRLKKMMKCIKEYFSII